MDIDNFKKKYLSLFSDLAGRSNTKNPEELCQEAYHSLTPEERNDPSEVNRVFLKKWEKSNRPVDRYRLVKQLIGTNPSNLGFEGEIVSLEKICSIVEPYLNNCPLLPRVVGALRILGWENPPISFLINDTIKYIQPLVKEKILPRDAEMILGKVRQNLMQQLLSFDKNYQWLHSMINYSADYRLEAKSLEEILDYSRKPAETRFARGRRKKSGTVKPDKTGKLRDIWQEVLTEIRRNIEKEKLFNAC